MSNWCEGTLKVRGKLKDVEQWVKENVSVFHSDFVKDQNGKIKGLEEDKIPDGVKVENSDGEVLEITISEDAYIAETRRHFVQPGTYFALLYQKTTSFFVWTSRLHGKSLQNRLLRCPKNIM